MGTKQQYYDETDGTWRRPTVFYNQYVKWLLYLIIIIFTIWSAYQLRVPLERLLVGLDQGTSFIARAFPPEVSDPTKMSMLWGGLLETIYIAMVATAGGVLISLPVAFMAAGNLAPRPVYLLGRTIIVLSRSVHALIWGILFVKAVGLGPFAGVLAIVVTTVGMFAKLLAEDIEDIDGGQVEALRATGAPGLTVLMYSVVPQILPRFVGLTIYRWDINIRLSTIVGIVGAGGIGVVLMNSVDRYEFDFTATILITIIVVVLIAEAISAYVRKWVN